MKEKKNIDMIHTNPARSLLLFAMPLILGNLFQQFYNMADSIIVGRFIGESSLAAVGASYSLTNVFIMIAIGGGVGTSVLVSQYFGAGKLGEMKSAVVTSLITFAFLSIILAVVGLVGNGRILNWLGTPKNILPEAQTYLGIYFLGLPFLFMYNILSAMFNALGDSKTPLYLLIFSSVFNVVLDLFFVRVLQLGVAGVAIATVLAQGVSVILSICLFLAKLHRYPDKITSYFDFGMLGQMMKIAIPSILQQSIVSIGMLLVQSVVNGFGSSILAGYSAATRIESICIVPMIAMGTAMSTFTAQNIGAQKPERVRQAYKMSYKIVGLFAVVLFLLLLVSRTRLISAFLEESAAKEAFQTGVAYLTFDGCFYFLIGLKAITDGVLRGSGDVGVYTAANLVNLAIRVAVANLLAPVIGISAVWYAIPMGWFANYLISWLRYRSGAWDKKRMVI